jgi:MFS family permease
MFLSIFLGSVMPILAWFSYGITTFFVLFQFFLQITAGLMARKWMHDFDLTTVQVGNLSAAFFYAYVLLQIPVGIAYDRYGVRKILITASLLLTSGCFLLGYATSYPMAFIARLLMGAGSSFGFVGMLYVTASWFSSRKFAVLVGLAETLAMVFVAIGAVALASLIYNIGWRHTMVISGISSAIVTLLIFIFIRDAKSPANQNTNEKISLRYALKYALTNRQIWLAGIYGFAMIALVNVFASLWGVPFFRHSYQAMDLHTAASLISAIFMGIAVGGPFNAWLSNLINKRKPIMIGFCVTTLILMSILFAIPDLSLGALYLLLFFAGFFSSAYIQTFAITKESVQVEQRATCLATVNMILMSCAPLLQPLIGYLIHLGASYRQAVMILPGFLVIAFIAALLLEEPISPSND